MFLLFILCSILPLVVIAAISLYYVGDQLEVEAKKRLYQQCKSKGLMIFERLAALERELTMFSDDYAHYGINKIDRKPFDIFERDGSGWRHIFVISKDQMIVKLTTKAGQQVPIDVDSIPRPQMDQAILMVSENPDGVPLLFLIRLVDPEAEHSDVIVGEINPLYLWGIGAAANLPPEIDLTVIIPPATVLISSIENYTTPPAFLNSLASQSFSGNFESHVNGQAYINSYWSLFLKHRFAASNWTIIYSQTKSSVMLPVTNFRSIFFLLVLLTFWIILMLSIRVIRIRTVPIDQLKTAARKIADGELGHHITVKSGDEFEILADTFNEMSSALKKSQAILLQTAKMSTFGQMSAGIIHEIGQPLTAIRGYAELLRMDLPKEKQNKYVSTINRETARLFNIIDKFRSFSRISEDVFSPIIVNDIFDRVIDLMSHQLEMKSIVLDFDKGDHIPLIYGDANAIQQAILNLITNAMDALDDNSRDNRKITVSATSQGDTVRIDIGDNGCGIPEDIRSSIFDPFFTTKGEDKGTGLGLAIISSIIHKHGATITCTSTRGEGTTFHIIFPVYKKKNRDAQGSPNN